MIRSACSGKTDTSAQESPEHLPVQYTNWNTQAHGLFGTGAVALQGLVFFTFSLLMILCSGLRKAFKGSDPNEQVSLIMTGKAP